MSNTDKKLKEIRRLLKEAYDNYFTNDPDASCKSAEGQISIYYGNYWDDGDDLIIRHIEIYSYVFGPHRLHSFKNIDEALETVRQWHKEEMDRDYELEAIKEKDYWDHYYKMYPEKKISFINPEK